ncbi:MAG: translation initiation factor IF-3 [Bdellovibrionaceae bacterium]|nr:translation initiation factor IF-3 [Pseudobdellovibrionaceae bacterium]MDW8190738.1 translation initiation factor IF-3 [Pseudobdellovibrionaceae bacterium]
MNHEIRAPQVRLIDENGEMLGIMTSEEALRIARNRGLDLLEVAANSNPPTCKIIDYGKYKYEQKKKQAQARKNQVIIVTKEIQLRPRTDVHDIEFKTKHARRFLLDGDKVKISVQFLGREMAHQEIGLETLNKVLDSLKDLCMVETPPKMEGKQLFALIAPDPAKIRAFKKAQEAAAAAAGSGSNPSSSQKGHSSSDS